LNCGESLPPMPFDAEAVKELADLFSRLVKEAQ
jgi:hypothetical protein